MKRTKDPLNVLPRPNVAPRRRGPRTALSVAALVAASTTWAVTAPQAFATSSPAAPPTTLAPNEPTGGGGISSAAAPTASPAIANANPCGTNHYGSTWYAEYGGYSTTYYYATCSNLTIQQAYWRDFYAGYYYGSGAWHEGSRGYVYFYTGLQPAVLVSGVITGTAEKINSYNSDTGISWWN